MATNDVNLQVINSMTQEQMQSLKDSSGKIPSLANQLIMTDEEDTNLSQLRTKVLWTNPNINSAFGAQTVTFENNEIFDYFLIISRYNINVDSYVSHFGEVNKGIHITDARAKSGSHFAMYERSATTTQTSVTFSDADEQYTDGSFVVSNITLVPYQIIGLKKAPAMIYTGAELHEGNGISIENGVIGVKSLLKLNTEARWSSAQSTTGILTLKSYVIDKTYNDSALHINYTCPISNNANGYGSFLTVKIDGVEAVPRVLSNFSGFFTLNRIVNGISSGNHTIEFCIANGGSGTTAIPAYEQMTGTVVEVL